MTGIDRAPRLGVAPLCALDVPVAQYVRAAGSAGFDEVGLRAVPVSAADPAFPADPADPDLADIETAIAQAGVRVLDLEVFSVRPGVGPDQWEPVLRMGQRLGASYLNIVGDHPDPRAFDDLVMRLSADARAVGVTPVLKPIAYRPFDDFAWALRLAERAE